jgi:hypothetical protein
LEYNIETMRITDPGEEAAEGFRKPMPSMLDTIKAKSTVNEPGEKSESSQKWERPTGTPAWEQAPKVTADVQSAKLKQLLGQIKQS